MGNRGILHNDKRVVVKHWVGKAWVACDPKFKSIDRRPLFQPGRYSELFFLDEATAFAAGHRPCAYCQRERFNHFKSVWRRTYESDTDARSLEITRVDAVLHQDRVSAARTKNTYVTEFTELPDGTMFAFGGKAFLLHKGKQLVWSHEGYSVSGRIPKGSKVEVLTPRSIVKLYSVGYTPLVHASADA